MKTASVYFLTLIISFLILACRSEKEPLKLTTDNFKLKKVKDFKIEVPEPSDLALSFDGKALWTVSDETSTVYLITFDGKILKQFEVDGYDLEGVTVLDENKIAVILERTREVLTLTNDGQELARKEYDLPGRLNSGLEGIAYSQKDSTLFLVNEKNPGLLLECDADFNIVKRTELNFAKDYSAIFVDEQSNDLWILSDESAGFYICDRNGKVKRSIQLEIPQMEGLTVDITNRRLYIISDNTEKLYIYDLKIIK